MLRPVDPFVAVFAASPRRQMLVASLKDNGIDAFYAPDCDKFGGAGRTDAVLVDLDIAENDISNLRAAFPSAQLVLTPDASVPEGKQALRLHGLDEFPWLRSHLMLERRRRIRSDEHRIRLATRRTFGLQDPALSKDPGHVVFGGSPNPRLLGLQSELRRHGIRLTPCISAATFIDCIDTLPISAVVFDGALESPFNRAWKTRHSMPLPSRRTSVIVIGERSDGGHDLDGIDRFLETGLSLRKLAEAIIDEIDCCTGAADTRIESAFTDPSSGLPTRAYFERHLENQMSFARSSSLPHALATFRLITDGSSEKHPLRSFCETLVRFARAEDFCAKIDWQTVCISVRSTDFRDATSAAERLSRTLSHHLPNVQHIWRVAEMRHHHDAAALISASLPSAAERYFQVRSA